MRSRKDRQDRSLLPARWHGVSAGSSFCRGKLCALLAVLLIACTTAVGQDLMIPENPLNGRFVFEQKGCISCHAIEGQGGKIGPDLGKKRFYGTFLDLAAIMWNHSPVMLRRMRELDLPFPEFDQKEIMELIAFLYYLRYLDEPGDLYRGKILVKEKGCLNCHSVGGKGKKVGPAFDKLKKFVSPLYMAQALWNHGPGMEKELAKRGLRRPTFSGKEIVDLSAYLRSASKGKNRDKVYMSPGNPRDGRVVFEKKGCEKCHAVDGDESKPGPNLRKLEWNYSVTEIAGLMWNHGSVMRQMMREYNIAWPRLEGKEMADLIAYLYFLKFADEPGNAGSGKKIFTAKGCAQCHGPEGRGGEIGPDLRKAHAVSSSVNLARIMWNHAPIMEELITEKAMKWPELTGQEMRDLYAFLQTIKK